MIYVHIPFCKSFCTYCGFYSETADCYGRYVNALLREIECRKSEIGGTGDVNTLYIGGGTPSVLPLPLLSKLVEALKEAAGVEKFDEFTIEVNPDDVVRGSLTPDCSGQGFSGRGSSMRGASAQGSGYPEALKELGVTRVSVGIQSFHDPVLKWMNRRHDGKTAKLALQSLFDAGIEEVSADLIFGLPEVRTGDGGPAGQRHGAAGQKSESPGQEPDGQYVPLLSDELWRRTVGEICSLGRGHNLHVSAYQLSVEPDSAFEKMIENGRCRELSDEACERQYDILCRAMADEGYNHYEISNFAKPGHEARHNSAYWRHVPYVGFGPGAHSLELLPGGGRRRSWNNPDLAQYLETCAPERGCRGNFEDNPEANFEALRGCETLSREQIALENVMLGLRTSAGCPLRELEEACNADALRRAVADGHLIPVGHIVPASHPVPDGGRKTAGTPGSDGAQGSAGTPGPAGAQGPAAAYYRIPEKYFFISDNIISSLVSGNR